MPINKNALIRYQTLNKCFSNYGKKYYFENLLEEVNEKLLEENPNSEGVKTRQLRADIQFMKSEAGYSAPIIAHKEGKKAFYRYETKEFSINNSPLSETEMQHMKNAISILQRFEGTPQFEWIQELMPVLNDKFDLKENNQTVIGYSDNIDYAGYNLISPLFEAITNQTVLKINYHPFNKNIETYVFHPQYLKQYNNRWFLFGYNQTYEVQKWNLALDRIKDFSQVNEKYLKSDIDWNDHFENMIGVTVPLNKEVEEVELVFSKEQAPYVQTKPLHPSQKSKIINDIELLVKLKLVVNYELEMKLLSFGDKVTVIKPVELKNRIKERLSQALNNYN